MFLENTINHSKQSGWMEVICGSMFSGKTEELIRRLRRAEMAGQQVEIFKPKIDVRYSDEDIVSHNDNKIRSTAVDTPNEILLLGSNCDVVGIDEAQFFDESVVEVANQLANSGTRVVIAGLDMDFMGRPFGPMPNLMATAEYVTKVHAICKRTGNLANYSLRTSASKDLVQLGETDSYEAVSRRIFWEEMQKQEKNK
ncbi:thymidine kinase [Elizabethkingia ursingii]|jgi:thymidine kinase|uniref:Thymidine kinase n=1 Tax=Elizabethkingia ursingii TaxID=1756150 RepID=A0AAJ3NDM6_9FLAO|nr:thymidine kinase [Elizabethkingia ursingii]MDR2227877.1 thymidine kinase [Flavobacteriaceae bacterium]AQX08838.1 thymidine kinase [Elizabethkingia ursingii]KUY31385.1 thymidine kinase [Elizabethkingia ursingii]OPB77696.1 thymidine kinase [Elizabethkingia ursingii]OPC06841.1 thymidine kinase [Elizabethkingia ursingii]